MKVRVLAKIRSALALVVLTVGTLIALAVPAAAGPTYQIVDADNDPYSGIYLRNGTSMANVTRDGAHYVLYGTNAELLCGTWGESVGPYANRRWHQVRVLGGSNAGRVGYVADRYVNTPNAANQPTPGEPECGFAAQPPANPPAQTPTGTYLAAAQQVRFCVNTGLSGCGTTLGGIATPSIAQNASVSMVCWVDGSNFTYGYTTNRWFWVRSGSGEGFVSASLVRNQTSVPACSSNRAIWAAQTAVQRYGETWARSADKALFSNAEWAPGDVGEWAGDCPKPPYVGWRAAGVSIPKGDAIANYRTYSNAGRIKSGAPPVGAVAFYNVTKWGHEVISLGNGLVLTTTGTDGNRTANTVRRYGYWSNYLGWVLPA